MKYTKEEIKAIYEYDRMLYEHDRMIYGNFMDFDEYRKIVKKASRKAKYLSFLKILTKIKQ